MIPLQKYVVTAATSHLKTHLQTTTSSPVTTAARTAIRSSSIKSKLTATNTQASMKTFSAINVTSQPIIVITPIKVTSTLASRKYSCIMHMNDHTNPR